MKKKVIIAVAVILAIFVGYFAYVNLSSKYCLELGTCEIIIDKDDPNYYPPANNATTTVVEISSTTPIISNPNGDTTSKPELMMVTFYVIDLEAKNTPMQETDKIGCGDAVVPVQYLVPKTTRVLEASLVTLLDIKTQELKSGNETFYNALYQSNLKYASGAITKDGVATIKLTGQTMLGGECDDPRAIAQIRRTVEQFATVKKAEIYINDVLLEDHFSLK